MHQVTATELAALLNKPLNHVVRVCLLQLIRQGQIRTSTKGKSLRLKFSTYPHIRYQRTLAKFYKTSQPVTKLIRRDVAQEFLNELFQVLKDKDVFSRKGFFRKKWVVTAKGQEIIRVNRGRLKGSANSVRAGLGQPLVRAIAMDRSFGKLVRNDLKSVLKVQVSGKRTGDWFHATWAARDRLDAMETAVRHRFGQF